MTVPPTGTGEQYFVEGITELLKDFLPQKMLSIGVPGGVSPDPISGYSDDPSIDPRDAGNSIYVWASGVSDDDAAMHSDHSMSSYSTAYENIVVNIRHTFTIKRSVIGKYKRLMGESIRDVVRSRILQYVKTLHSVKVYVDYERGPSRFAGGQRRVSIGNETTNSTMLDAIHVTIMAKMKRNIQVRPELFP